MEEKIVDYANTTNVEFIVDPKVLYYSMVENLKLFAHKFIK